MFLLLPISTDVPVRRVPWVNYVLIAVNVLVFLWTFNLQPQSAHGTALATGLKPWAEVLTLEAESPRWFQFLSSMFLHGGWVHLIGNMIFLWVFGNSLNNKLGHLAYLLFYLASGFFAGAGYVLFQSAPVLGASGAIFGVVAGFLVLFPFSRVTIFYWIFFFFFGFLDFSGVAVVGGFVLYNLIAWGLGWADGTAYLAHLSGAGFGFGAAMLLLLIGAVGRDQFDLLSLLRRWNQRRNFRLYMAHPQRQAEARYGRMARPVESHDPDRRPPADPVAERIAELRAEIGQALRSGDAGAAGRLYSQLRAADANQVLPARQQLDLGNYLMSAGQHALAADAYEQLLGHYPAAEQAEQVQLLLGMLYARYLNNPVRAKQYLEQSQPRLRDPNQIEQCRQELARVAERLNGG